MSIMMSATAAALLGHRQKSMPVQIDTQFLRIIPKHCRKRIKSADSEKKHKNNKLTTFVNFDKL